MINIIKMLNNNSLLPKQLPAISENIIAALAYFDVFNYPLTKGELFLFLTDKCDARAFNSALAYLLVHDQVYCFDTFYTLKRDPKIASRRRTGNQKAAVLIKVAEKVGRLLIRFPYVRGIAVSGSLSKNFADDQSDIDLFIITASNRLWIARTILHVFKKFTFLVNKEHYFCMNYFIDEQSLQIKEKNIYTATEVVTLIPLEGDIAFEKFYSANNWTMNFLPNNYMRVSSAKAIKNGFGKTLVETILNNPVGNVIDSLLWKITASRWNKKTRDKKLNIKGLVMDMDAGKHYAKPDPTNFQQKLIQRYKNRLAELFRNDESALAHM